MFFLLRIPKTHQHPQSSALMIMLDLLFGFLHFCPMHINMCKHKYVHTYNNLLTHIYICLSHSESELQNHTEIYTHPHLHLCLSFYVCLCISVWNTHTYAHINMYRHVIIYLHMLKYVFLAYNCKNTPSAHTCCYIYAWLSIWLCVFLAKSHTHVNTSISSHMN